MLLVKNIGFKVADKIILSDVNASFDSGKLNLIIGPNGAGKSSLIKIISGQLKASSGSVFYEDTSVNQLSISQLAKIRAVLSQNTQLTFPLRVEEVVMMGRYPHFVVKPTSNDESACFEAMRLFNVDELAKRNYLSLSGGEMQRVQFARVISQIWYPHENTKRYLILDEPLTFLDIYFQFQFMNTLKDLLKNNQLTVIGVLHDLNLVARFADNILLLDKGNVIAQGNAESVLTKENIKATYLLEPTILQQNNSKYLFFE